MMKHAWALLGGLGLGIGLAFLFDSREAAQSEASTERSEPTLDAEPMGPTAEAGEVQPESEAPVGGHPDGMRLLLGLVGLAMAASGGRRERGTKTRSRRRVGQGRGSIVVRAKPERVFDFCRDWSHLPLFLRYLPAVQPVDERHFTVQARGDHGEPLEWICEVTRFIPGEVLAWESEQGAPVRLTSTLSLDVQADGGTRVDLQVSCLAVTGAGISQEVCDSALAELPRDLARLKILVERGPRRARKPNQARD